MVDPGGFDLWTQEEPLNPASDPPVAITQVRRQRPRVPLVLLQLGALGAALYWLVRPRLGDTAQVLGLLDDVNFGLVAVGTVLGALAVVAYAQVTRMLLPRNSRPGLGRSIGVVVSSLGVNRVAPLGVAAGSAVAYKLLVCEGIARGDVAFAMGVQSIGSAFVLQIILWPAMLVAASVNGISRALASGLLFAGGFGVAFLGLVALVLRGLFGRRESTIGRLTRVAQRMRLGRDRAGEAISAACERLDQLRANPATMLKSASWATLNWIADSASLWVFLVAFGADVSPLWVLVAFGIASIVTLVPITPGSLGVTETTLAIVLVGFGAAAPPVFLGIAAYRLVHYWLPIPGGALAYALLRVHRPDFVVPAA